MEKTARFGVVGFLLIAAGIGSGCESEDADRLGKMGRVTAAKLEVLTNQSNERILGSLHAVQGNADETNIETRVQSRLRWEKSLADLEITVIATDANVELKGNVRNQEQRKKAIELTESTVGVENVVDSLIVPTEGQ